MAIQTINVGSNANDGTGDQIRSAFQKVNSNFTDVVANNNVTISIANSALILANNLSTSNLAFSGTILSAKTTATDSNVFIRFDSNNYAYLSIPSSITASSENLRLRNDNGVVEIGAGTIETTYTSNTWYFLTDGTIQYPDGYLQTGASISITELKAIVANASTWGAFQSAIAAL